MGYLCSRMMVLSMNPNWDETGEGTGLKMVRIQDEYHAQYITFTVYGFTRPREGEHVTMTWIREGE